MSGLILEEMLLLSLKEQKGKKIVFHPQTTIIKGNNNTGKSCLIKSIYYTFGAEPKMNPKWTEAEAIVLIKFDINDKKFSILRSGKLFALFDDSNKLIRKYTRVVDGLGPCLAELFKFKIQLNDDEGKFVTPPPAYFLLPFYVDQDTSWEKPWSSFKNLYQFKDWKRKLLEYHVGIKPNEYYVINGSIEKLKEQIKKYELEENALQDIIERVRFSDTINFDIDIESFKEEINELLRYCDELKIREERLKNKLLELNNHKINLETQIKITEKAESEANLDYNYIQKIKEEFVECPTCGAQYENSFINKFELAQDKNRCAELLLKLRVELLEINEKIDRENKLHKDNIREINEINRILEKKLGDIKLIDIIQGEGEKKVKVLLKDNLSDIKVKKAVAENEMKALKERIKKYDNRDRKQEIEKKYHSYLYNYSKKLNVKDISENSDESIDISVRETGSDLPRALLAYYYSILQLMNEYSSSYYLPIIIDSPNQQDQDTTNEKTIVEFLRDNQPKDSQLILGLVNTCGIRFNGKIIELTERESLLQKSEYNSVYKEVKPLLEKAMTSTLKC